MRSCSPSMPMTYTSCAGKRRTSFSLPSGAPVRQRHRNRSTDGQRTFPEARRLFRRGYHHKQADQRFRGGAILCTCKRRRMPRGSIAGSRNLRCHRLAVRGTPCRSLRCQEHTPQRTEPLRHVGQGFNNNITLDAECLHDGANSNQITDSDSHSVISRIALFALSRRDCGKQNAQRLSSSPFFSDHFSHVLFSDAEAEDNLVVALLVLQSDLLRIIHQWRVINTTKSCMILLRSSPSPCNIVASPHYGPGVTGSA